MSNYSSLKATIDANVKANNNQEITGAILNSVLNAVVNSMGAKYQYAGVATPDTDPGTPDQNLFYIATTPGTYTNFGGIVVASGECVVLKGTGSTWSKEDTGIDLVSVSQNTSTGHTDITIGSTTTPVASVEEVSQLGRANGGIVNSVLTEERIDKHINLLKGRKYIFSIPESWDYDNVVNGLGIFQVGYRIGDSLDVFYEIVKGENDGLLVGEHFIDVPNIDVDEYFVFLRGDSGQSTTIVITDITENGAKKIVFGNDVLPGYFVRAGNDFYLTPNDTYCVTSFIKLKKNCIYTLSGFTKMGGTSVAVAKFDLEKNFIETFYIIPTGNHQAQQKWYYRPTEDCYIICSIHIDDINQAYIAGSFEASFVYVGMNGIKQPLYDFNKLIRYVYNYDNNGAYIRRLNNTYGITNKIWVKRGDVLYITGITQSGGSSVKNAKFSGDGIYLGFFNYQTAPYLFVSDFDGYILFSIHISNWNTFNVIKIYGQNLISVNDEIKNDSTILEIVTDNRTGRFDFTTVGVLDYYAAFDELAGTYRDFIKQEPIGVSSTPTGEWATKDSNTYPINRYTFKKYGASPTRKIVIEGATHGDSQYRIGDVIYNNPNDGWYNNDGDSPQNILSIYFFLVDFLKNPTKNELYKNLYENYEIEFIPILNPWGVQNHSRGNGRGVDLARNFDWMWVEGYDPSRNLTNGTAPFSENESAAFRDFYNNLTGVDFCFEVHSRGNILVREAATWLTVSQDVTMRTIANAIIQNVICNYQYGFPFGYNYAIESDLANLSNWVYKVKGVDSIVTEAAQSYNNDIHTRNTKTINYWMTCILGNLITWWAAYKNGKVLLV